MAYVQEGSDWWFYMELLFNMNLDMARCEMQQLLWNNSLYSSALHCKQSPPQIPNNNNPFAEPCQNHSCFQMDNNICLFFISHNCVFWNECKLSEWYIAIRLDEMVSLFLWRTRIWEKKIGLVSHPHILILLPFSTQYMLWGRPTPVSSQTGTCPPEELLQSEWNDWCAIMSCTAFANTIVWVSDKESHSIKYSQHLLLWGSVT